MDIKCPYLVGRVQRILQKHMSHMLLQLRLDSMVHWVLHNVHLQLGGQQVDLYFIPALNFRQNIEHCTKRSQLLQDAASRRRD